MEPEEDCLVNNLFTFGIIILILIFDKLQICYHKNDLTVYAADGFDGWDNAKAKKR